MVLRDFLIEENLTHLEPGPFKCSTCEVRATSDSLVFLREATFICQSCVSDLQRDAIAAAEKAAAIECGYDWDNPACEQAKFIRAQREIKLLKSDWTQVADSPLSSEKRAEWADYRNKLRNLSTEFVTPDLVVWPIEP